MNAKKTKQIELDAQNALNELDMDIFKSAIQKQYGTAYAYCKAFGIPQSRVSNFLRKEINLSLKEVMKHAHNLNMRVKIQFSQP